ncbi:MAG: polysaccharide deacetylase family protein [Candidatus Omnitrophica bacterium]|nr:polysaccharide deacetylase family protein [Candidatus Omnitrophota bacterium]
MSRFKKFIITCGVLVIILSGLYVFLRINYYPAILMYHNIDAGIARGNTISVSPEIFLQQMAFIKSRNYKVVSLNELCGMIKKGERLPGNLVVITFDDGYKDNLAAVNVLRKLKLPATIFIVLDWVGKEGYLTKQDLNWIIHNSPVSLGSHTLSHFYLPELSADKQREEVIASRKKAREEFGIDLSFLAYPVGGFTPEVLRAAEDAGYECACTTNRGIMRKPDIYALRRIKITNHDLGIRLWGKLSGFYNLFRKLKPPY